MYANSVDRFKVDWKIHSEVPRSQVALKLSLMEMARVLKSSGESIVYICLIFNLLCSGHLSMAFRDTAVESSGSLV